MTFFEYINNIELKKDTVVTIGNFDGLHLGHMELINKAVELGKTNNLTSIAFTYDVHPLSFLYSKLIHLLMERDEKKEILKSKGIDRVLFAPFDEEICSMTSQEFVDEVLVKKLKAKHLVMGADSKFGKEMNSIDHIKPYCEERGIQVHIIPLLIVDGLRISSSYIRMLVEQGEIEKANKFLGRNYSVESTVIHGKKLGRKLGFPTANLMLSEHHAIPAPGVYETIVELEGILYKGATNVGTNPTVGDKNLTVETYILGFEDDIYGKHLKVIFLKRLRPEIKFSSLEALIEQMVEDVKQIKPFTSK